MIWRGEGGTVLLYRQSEISAGTSRGREAQTTHHALDQTSASCSVIWGSMRFKNHELEKKFSMKTSNTEPGKYFGLSKRSLLARTLSNQKRSSCLCHIRKVLEKSQIHI